MVQQGDIEFAVITLPSQLPEKLIKETIWVDKLNVVVSSDHELAALKKVDLKHLANYPCVLTSKDTETYKVIQREFDEHGLVLSVQMDTNNLETLKMLAGAGLGWSLLPQTMLDKTLKPLNVAVDLTRDLGLVAHKKRSLSNAAKALRALIQSS